MTFELDGLVGVLRAVLSCRLRELRQFSWRVYALGTFALFEYHALYFSALRLAPPAEAILIAYL